MQPPPMDTGNPNDRKFDMGRMQRNEKMQYYCKTWMAIFSGCVTGILGFTGLSGFLCYVLAQLLMSAVLIVKMKFTVEPYFPYGVAGILQSGITGGALSFMLTWTLFYDVCHLY